MYICISCWLWQEIIQLSCYVLGRCCDLCVCSSVIHIPLKWLLIIAAVLHWVCSPHCVPGNMHHYAVCTDIAELLRNYWEFCKVTECCHNPFIRRTICRNMRYAINMIKKEKKEQVREAYLNFVHGGMFNDVEL